MQADKIEAVMSEFLGEGYRIVGDDGACPPRLSGWIGFAALTTTTTAMATATRTKRLRLLSKMALPAPSIRAYPCAKSGMNTRTSL